LVTSDPAHKDARRAQDIGEDERDTGKKIDGPRMEVVSKFISHPHHEILLILFKEISSAISDRR